MIWSQEIRNDKPLYLTTHKSGWPPVSRHPSQEPAALSIWSLPSVACLDSRLITHGKPGPQPDKVGQQGNYVLTGPGYFKGCLPGATRQAYMHGFQMVNQLGPPLEMFEAR